MKQTFVLFLCLRLLLSSSLRMSSKLNFSAKAINLNCKDQGAEAIHPLISSLASFFNTHQAHVMPVALTALSALRFGGVAMEFGDHKVAFDDDVDFLVTVPKDMNTFRIMQLVSHFSAYLYRETSLKSIPCFNQILAGEPVTFNASEPDKKSTVFHINVIVDLPSEVTQQSNTAWSRYVKKLFGSTGSEWLSMMTSLRASTIPREQDMAESCLGGMEFAQRRNFTILDLWFDHPAGDVSGNLIEQVPSGDKKQVSFAGVNFEFPVRDHAFAAHFQSVMCNDYGRDIEDVDMTNFCKAPSFCALALPQYGGYDERIKNVGNAGELFASCASDLDARGLRSFKSCHH